MFIEYLSKDPRFFFAMLLTVVVSICLHELAHGLMAIWLGDRTPIEQERMTLSPLVHMGIPSLICLLLAGIAWGAMPVDRARLRGRFGPAVVAAAGPAMNILLAVLAIAALGLWQRFDLRRGDELSQVAQNGMYLLWVVGVANVLLALFNLLPIPPLDGSRILGNFSHSFDTTVNMLAASAPIVMIQFSILIFGAAGYLLTPAAVKIAKGALDLVRGS